MHFLDTFSTLCPSSSFILLLGSVLLLYLCHVNRALSRVPEEAERAAIKPWTEEELKAVYKKVQESPVDIRDHLPPKRGRRYIVVGGAGLVGGAIVQHLLARGEDLDAIRIVDLRRPTPQVAGGIQRSAELRKVNFEYADISTETSTHRAFSVPWPLSVAHRPLTVFHTAAVIRFSERAKYLLSLSEKVNVTGTKNVLSAAKAAGATCFIATSSGSIAIRRPNFWLPPWRRWPKDYYQSISDADYDLNKPHETFYGNYAVSKATAERLVCDADDPKSNFRTGCIRPASGVYGSSQDNTIGTYLRRGGGPSWITHIINNFVYTENVSLAHLLYEQHLLAPAREPNSDSLVDIGGRAFTVTDPNKPIRFRDVGRLASTLSISPVEFVAVPPVLIFLLAHLVEFYVLIQHRYLGMILPPVTGDLAMLQPALFAVSSVHLVYDDRQARKNPQEGGLGYRAPWTSAEAMCKQVSVWNEESKWIGNGTDSSVEEGMNPNNKPGVVQEVAMEVVNVAAKVAAVPVTRNGSTVLA